MSKQPTVYVCDIDKCDNEAPMTPTGKRDYLSAHYKQTIGVSEDRQWTLKKPILELAEIDLCTAHYQQYVDSLPIQSSERDGYRPVLTMVGLREKL